MELLSKFAGVIKIEIFFPPKSRRCAPGGGDVCITDYLPKKKFKRNVAGSVSYAPASTVGSSGEQKQNKIEKCLHFTLYIKRG